MAKLENIDFQEMVIETQININDEASLYSGYFRFNQISYDFDLGRIAGVGKTTLCSASMCFF